MLIPGNTYTKTEIEKYFKVTSKKQVINKLLKYELVYQITKDRNYTVTINDISDIGKFKLYCVFELDFDPHIDFITFAEFLYYLLCDDEFPSLPNTQKEEYMKSKNRAKTFSRQTIEKHIKRMEEANLIARLDGNIKYYFSYRGQTKLTDVDTYKKAWREYFYIKSENDNDSNYARSCIISEYGGMPRKHYTPIKNVFNLDKINTLIDLVANLNT